MFDRVLAFCMNKSQPPKLSEKDFIHEGYRQDPYPFWFWFILIGSVVAALWGGYAWYSKALIAEYAHNPFLQVTNRDMSLFLWQEPDLMRINAPQKSIYMPGFQYVEKVSLEVPFADDYVIAPPEVIFRYHAWHRLVGNEFTERPIPVGEFKLFLQYASEWLPENWPGAPKGYAETIQSLGPKEDLTSILPLQVKRAFQGWKNYFMEGDAINVLVVSYGEVEDFLSVYPGYARNNWRNIAGLGYLSSTLTPIGGYDEAVPTAEIPAFLRVALYNYLIERNHP